MRLLKQTFAESLIWSLDLMRKCVLFLVKVIDILVKVWVKLWTCLYKAESVKGIDYPTRILHDVIQMALMSFLLTLKSLSQNCSLPSAIILFEFGN